MSVGLVEVLLIGTSDDMRLLDRLAGDLGRSGLSAFPNPVGPGRPLEFEAAASVPVVVVVWTRTAAVSTWLVESIDVARKVGPVIAAVCDDVERPEYLRDVPVVDIVGWRAEGDYRLLDALAAEVTRLASDDEASEAGSEAVDVKTLPDGAPDDVGPAVEVDGVLPEVAELLGLAAVIGRRRDLPANGLDVVVAALVLSLMPGLDDGVDRDGAAAALHRAVPEPREDHVVAALEAVHAGSLGDLDVPDAAAPMPALADAPGLVTLLEHASSFAAGLTPPVVSKLQRPPPETHARHLIGVALAGSTLPPAVARALGADDETLAATLLDAVRQEWPQEDPARWAALLTRPPGEAVATFHHDDTRERNLLAEDSLDIAPHVRALALLVSSKVLKPPLAVGLFGDWGSGKTYFMRALRQEVDRITRQARDSGLRQRELPVYRNVAQIEFNAWHFVDADLWASLADYIFANLRITEGEGANEVSRRRELYVAKLSEQGAAIRQVESKRQHLEARIALSESELEQVRSQTRRELGIEQQARAVLSVSPGLKQGVDALATRLGLPAVGSSVADLEQALVEARDVTTRARSTVGVLSGRFGSGWSLLAFAALLLGPLVLWLTTYLDVDAVQRAAATVAGFVAGGAAWVRTASAAAGSTLETIDRLGAALEREVEENPVVVQRRNALESLRAEEERLATEEVRLRTDLAKVQQALRELSPAKLLADFILSRNDSDDYRKHLGLASLIRRDFEALAEHIDGFNSSLEEEGAPEESDEVAAEGPAPSEVDYHVNRIVLYIDDLDRCPPETVAKVLQAVHLLLAFPLFVVVVGVDARWLSRSLAQHYQGLLDAADGDDDGSASPQDYLEKIFQIPFWLRPMPLDATGRLLDALTETRASAPSGGEGTPAVGTEPGPPSRVSRRPAPAGGPGVGDEDEAPPSGGAVTSEPATAEPVAADTVTSSGATAGVPAAAPRAYDLRISSTQITQAERDLMQELRPMLGRSPRSLTRYVNIYRLLKAVDQHDRNGRANGATAESQGDPDDVTMFLLAVLTGFPDVAQPLLTEIVRQPGTDERDGLLEVVRRARRRGDAENEQRHRVGPAVQERQWDDLERWLAEHGEWAGRQHVGSWARRAQRVARYSYRFDAIAPHSSPGRAGEASG